MTVEVFSFDGVVAGEGALTDSKKLTGSLLKTERPPSKPTANREPSWLNVTQEMRGIERMHPCRRRSRASHPLSKEAETLC